MIHKKQEKTAMSDSPTQDDDTTLAEEQPQIAQESEVDQAAQMKDQLLRAMAETENTRRRMQKEVEDAKAYAIVNFAREMLSVADNLDRALKATAQDKTNKSLIAGVEATQRQLSAVFEKFGIKKLESQGKPFDPHLHQVMMEVDDPSKPAGMIVDVLQDGYMIQDRLLREAMVSVAKGGPVKTKVDTSA